MSQSKPYTDQDSANHLRELTNLLYQSAGVTILLSFLAISALTFLISTEITDSIKFNLWAAMVGVLSVRAFDLVYWFVNLRGTDFEPKPTFIRYCAGIVISGVLWATFFITMFNQFNVLSMSSSMIVACAMSSGAAAVFAPSRRLCFTYITLLIVPFALLALQDERLHFVVLGGLGLCYWLAITSISLRSNTLVTDALSLKYSNAALLDEVKEERDEISRINDELRRSNEALDHANASLEMEVSKRTDDIHRLSSRDPLTGLMNRKGFMRLINRQLATSQRMNNSFALLFIDLDGFKQVNDSLGHQVGDGVLETVAERLARYSDKDNLGRWGGDEFVMLLPYANDDTAMAVAHATRSSISLPIEVESYQISLDATIGISLYPDHSTDAQGLIQLADLTMYEQKKIKPGSFALFNQSIYTQLQEELTLRDGLRNAIDENQFSLAYQPIVRSDTSDVWGFEALLRWTFNDKPVSPAVFIPLAEKSGLITDIGRWVLHRACIDAAQWATDEHAISVNVSVIQLMDDGFISTLDKVLSSSGLAPERLHIEITESVFADNKKKVQAQIEAIKQRKIQISIDDFGTGFSSLSQLQSLSFDHIKIDRAFVQNLEEGSDTIIRATLLIAKEFNCLTIAEGIETQEHVERLTSMGVDCLQGYLFAKPMPNSALPEWLEKHNARS